MITAIALRNFKNYKNTTITFDQSRLHAIVGQNSSGKTSLLQSIDYISQLAHQSFSAIFQHDRSPDYLVRVGADHFEVSIRGVNGNKTQHNWAAAFLCKQDKGTWQPRCSWETNGSSNELVGWTKSLKDAPSPIPQLIGHTVYLKLIARNLSQAAYSDEVVPRVEYDGTGLAPTLDYLRSENPKSFADLQSMLQQVIPTVQKVDVRRAKVEVLRERTVEVDGKALPYEERREMTGQEVVLSMSSGERIPAHAISEGTMLTLGLLTVLFNPQKPNLVLLDDIEQGLHPLAQRQLIAVLKQIIEQNPNLQILFSTHSPYVLDALSPSQVHVLNSTYEGYTIAGRLDEHPDAEWAKQTLTTGEFWDAEGEAWVLKERSSD